MPFRVLVTGFEPFGGACYNPSGEAALALDGEHITLRTSGCPRVAALVGRCLPVVWQQGADELQRHIEAFRPHVVLSLGMAQTTYRVEQRADDVKIAAVDNLGRLPKIVRLSPSNRLKTGLPRNAIEHAIAKSGGAVETSDDAGGFICNEVFYELMQTYYTRGKSLMMLRAGFIHVPNDTVVPSQVLQCSVNDAIRVAILSTLQSLSDQEYSKAHDAEDNV